MSLRPLHSLGLFLASVLALALVTPAVAQGVLSPPDDSGPGPDVYTGYKVAYLISGVRRDTSDGQETRIVCTNVGKVDADWAVQIFDGAGPGNLLCETSSHLGFVVGETDVFTTDSAEDNFLGISGICPNGDSVSGVGVTRVIARPKNAVLLCTASVIDAATRNVVATLPATPVGKALKIKIK